MSRAKKMPRTATEATDKLSIQKELAAPCRIVKTIGLLPQQIHHAVEMTNARQRQATRMF